jgi:sRNA-binding carbon storage regulator CsrA
LYKGLIITRKPSENKDQTFITFKDSNGETIEIKQTILGVVGNTVRMRIEAPDEVTILRGELLDNELIPA